MLTALRWQDQKNFLPTEHCKLQTILYLNKQSTYNSPFALRDNTNHAKMGLKGMQQLQKTVKRYATQSFIIKLYQ